ncbi:MAG TPA: cupin domain-containing protein [Oleiagrimonas sp.]|nr:cupin domain-containing protein [Oleiagrimonas sp.]
MSATPAIEVQATLDQPLGMSAETFLRDYWQKRPLLIRSAFADFKLPLEPDDLGGLALGENVLARLIEHDRDADRWTVHSAPLDEAIFGRLPDRDWTLLVQDVDKWDTDVAELLEAFRFLPSWRIDDIMVSYAEDGGGVGAHVDQYDVFLLQGHGRRRWRIDASDNPDCAFRDDVELKQLRHFAPSHDWTLEPGDMLYLPPGVPHDGVADGPCMTFSVGMRAPATSELLLDFAEHVAERLPESRRYADIDLAPAMHNGEIDAAALGRAATALGPIAASMTTPEFAEWFGGFITRYRCAQFAAPPSHAVNADELVQALSAGTSLLRHPWTRLAWTRHPGGTTLFASGESLACPRQLAERLCNHASLQFDVPPTDAECEVLTALVNQGHLVLRS